MLEITVTLHPFGNRARSKVLSVLQISNDASGDPAIGNYDVRRDDSDVTTACWRGRVEGWDRSRSFWALIREALTNPDVVPR